MPSAAEGQNRSDESDEAYSTDSGLIYFFLSRRCARKQNKLHSGTQFSRTPLGQGERNPPREALEEERTRINPIENQTVVSFQSHLDRNQNTSHPRSASAWTLFLSGSRDEPPGRLASQWIPGQVTAPRRSVMHPDTDQRGHWRHGVSNDIYLRTAMDPRGYNCHKATKNGSATNSLVRMATRLPNEVIRKGHGELNTSVPTSAKHGSGRPPAEHFHVRVRRRVAGRRLVLGAVQRRADGVLDHQLPLWTYFFFCANENLI